MIWLLCRLSFLLFVAIAVISLWRILFEGPTFTGVWFVARTYIHRVSIEPVREFGYYKISPIL